MQYKNATKIIIDKRKLDILIRLGCPDNQILELIKTGKFTKTGDSLIDETLECLADFKEFKNWGGNHNPKGINGCNKKKKRGQVDIQVDKQDDCQVVDKDIDKDKEEDKDLNKKNNKKEIYKEKFEEWWSYFPKLRAGSKEKTFEKYIKTIEKEKLTPEWLLERVKEYSKSREVENGYACGGERYFNDCKYNNHYELSEKEKAREEERRLTSNWWRE